MRIGILLSGRGSNFRAIHEAIQNDEVPAEIACVLSNVPTAPGILYARQQGLPAYALDSKGIPRAEFDQQLLALLAEHQVDLICLAGYLRLLSPEFIAAYSGRILNIHPSLLPDFKGLHAQRQALEAGASVGGCTVHYVDEGLDSGPVLLQAQVPILDGDTEETLSARILAEEHRLYPAALRLAIEKAR